MMFPLRMTGLQLMSVLLTLLLFGCTRVGPDFVRPEALVSPSWLEEGDERVKSDPVQYRAWWEAFGDPVLNGIIQQAYRENLALKIAGVRVLQARAQLGIAAAGLYPQTQQATGNTMYNQVSERSAQGAAAQAARGQSAPSYDQFTYWQDQISLNAAWELDFWGTFARAVESADATLLATVADYDNTLVTLTADAANSYILIRTLDRRLEIARQNANIQKEGLQIAEVRFKGGVSTERDVEQARTLLFNTQATIPILEAQSRKARNALAVLLGLSPGPMETILCNSQDIPAPPPQVAVGIPSDLLRRRPDVKSAELQAAAQCARIGMAKAELLPAFSLTGSFGFLSTDLGRFGLADMLDAKGRTASVGPSFQWNILNYGRITNNVRLQDARFQEMLLSYQNTVLKAQQEVEDSLAAFLRSQENAEYLAQSAGAAKRSLDLAMVQYQQGVTDFTTVLTAQQALLSAQDSFATALGNISSSLVGVYRALGGGWEIREGQDFVPSPIKEVMARRTNWGKLLLPSVDIPPAPQW